jgi:cytochrome c peroxidase
MRIFKVIVVLSSFIFIMAASFKKDKNNAAAISYYIDRLNALNETCTQLHDKALDLDQKELINLFEEARYQYKEIEFLVEYKYQSSANKINGAPLPESDAKEPNLITYPIGFQVLEPYIYEDLSLKARQQIVSEVSNIKTVLNNLIALQGDVSLNDSELLDALRLNLYRMIIKGISGFDSPVANTGVSESVAALTATKAVLSQFDHANEVISSIDLAINYVQTNQVNFNDFNRAIFISKYINPLCNELKKFQLKENIEFVNSPRAITVTAANLFEQGAINPMFFAPSYNNEYDQAHIELGKLLFYDSRLSSTGNRNCASCHNENNGFTDGLKTNKALLNETNLLRNTPTLWNAALQPVQFYDSRIAFLEDQIHDVITNESEMNGRLSEIAKRFDRDRNYKKLFYSTYKEKQVTPSLIKKALASYVRSLVALNSPFDQYMRGNANALNKEEINGFNLFMGKAKCGTCHFVPLFNGAVAPYYEKLESEVLGVPSTKDTLNAKLDTDSGKYKLYKIPYQLFAFKTTTLRQIAITAPYMHNGVYDTLEEVIDFYDRGGGAGMGMELENQTLSPDRLNLTATEKKNIILFLKSLTDTTVNTIKKTGYK